MATPGRQRDGDDRERRGGEQDAGAGRVESERLLEVGRERHELLPGDLADQDQRVEGEERAAHDRTVERRCAARLRSGAQAVTPVPSGDPACGAVGVGGVSPRTISAGAAPTAAALASR